MYCPNCNNPVNYENYCTQCGVKLTYVNNSVLINEEYEEIQNIHKKCDILKSTCIQTKASITESLENPDTTNVLENNVQEKKKLLNSMLDAKTNLTNALNSLNEILDDENTLTYIKGFDNLFGNVEEKIIETKKMIIETLNSISNFESFINNPRTSENQEIKNIHNQLDTRIHEIDELKKQLNTTITDDNVSIVFRQDANVRNDLKNDLIDLKETFSTDKDEISNSLNDSNKMNYLKSYDSVYGNVENKMRLCISKIDDIIPLIDNMLNVIEQIESPDTSKESEMGDGRLLDL